MLETFPIVQEHNSTFLSHRTSCLWIFHAKMLPIIAITEHRHWSSYTTDTYIWYPSYVGFHCYSFLYLCLSAPPSPAKYYILCYSGMKMIQIYLTQPGHLRCVDTQRNGWCSLRVGRRWFVCRRKVNPSKRKIKWGDILVFPEQMDILKTR